jgi:gliding motility-associated-like protein
MDDICFDTLTLADIIEVYPTPIADFSFMEVGTTPADGSVQFTNLSSEDGSLFFWNFDDGSTSIEENPLHRYFINGEKIITLFVENEYGCSDTAEATISHRIIKGLFVPNAFTPENGVSEVRAFKPSGVGLSSYRIEIYSTWGELLWFSEELVDGEPEEAWDGNFKGKIMPQDTYVWKVEAEFEDGTRWRGMKNEKGKLKRIGAVYLLR